jgi:squalene cyclase
MCRRLLLVGFAVLWAGPVLAGEPVPTADELRAAVAKALPLLMKGAVGHRENRTCFACHSQGLPIMAMVTARSRGIKIDEQELATQLKFIAEFLGRNRAEYLQGKGQGGQADTAGYALLTLELGGWQPDDTTAAVAEYLLLRQKDQDHWTNNSTRPPTEASPFTTSYVALRGLAAFATPEQQERVANRSKQLEGWLAKTPARDNEDRVFRLSGLAVVGAKQAEIDAAAQELMARQRDDGGWAQLDGGEPEAATRSDAYATSTALVALHRHGGLVTSDAAYRRGVRFLLKTQLEDGTWHIVSRSKPFQKYFETGFPHEKDQFISSAASGWAATALALALTPAGGG